MLQAVLLADHDVVTGQKLGDYLAGRKLTSKKKYHTMVPGPFAHERRDSVIPGPDAIMGAEVLGAKRAS